MSYKWGLNGNDLNWDFLTGGGRVNEICVNCHENIKEMRKEKRRALTDREMDNIVCEGHTRKYSGRGWAILHDTNGNHVSTNGKVPLAAFASDYLTDMLMDDSISKSMFKRIWLELLDRNERPKVVGVWGISNTTSFNVYYVDSTQDTLLVGVNNFLPKWYVIETEEVDNENKDYAGKGEDTLSYIKGRGSKWYMNECMHVD